MIFSLKNIGGPSRIWTYDQRIMSPLLSPLSYRPKTFKIRWFRFHSYVNTIFTHNLRSQLVNPHLSLPKKTKVLVCEISTKSLLAFFYFTTKMAPQPGLEPGTDGLTVRCSTNWATEELLLHPNMYLLIHIRMFSISREQKPLCFSTQFQINAFVHFYHGKSSM